ncbi:MAG: protein kinase [Myxococcota bacterium]
MDEGQILDGKYRLGRLLGEGSLGRVFEAQHTSLARTVAIKVFYGDLMVVAGGAERFLADARAARKVRHHNVVDVHEFGQIDEFTVYVVMERVEGCTLHAYLERHGRLGWLSARAIAQQIVAALKAAHRRRVLHRGLKATNCFVIRDGSPDLKPWIKVSDFAIVRTGAATLDPTADQTSVFLGDPAYAAPELDAESEPSVQSDVYAVGVLLYRMLTGVLPFTGDTPFHVLLAHAEEPVPSAREKVESITPEVDAIIQRALAKDPSERYESVRELEQALDEVPESAESSTRSPADRAADRAADPPKDPPKDRAHDEDAPGGPLDERETGLHRHAEQAPDRPVRDEAMHAAFERREEDDEPATSMFAPPRLFSYYGPAAQQLELEAPAPAGSGTMSPPGVLARSEPVRPAPAQPGPVRPGVVPPALARPVSFPPAFAPPVSIPPALARPGASPTAPVQSAQTKPAHAPPASIPPAFVPAPIGLEPARPPVPAPALPESTVCLDAAGRASSSRGVTGTVVLGAMERSASVPEATMASPGSRPASTNATASPAWHEPVARVDSTEPLRSADRVPEAPFAARVHHQGDARVSDLGSGRPLVRPGGSGYLAQPDPAVSLRGSIVSTPGSSPLPTMVQPLVVRGPARASSITSTPTPGQLIILVIAMLALGALVVLGLVCTARTTTVSDGGRREDPLAFDIALPTHWPAHLGASNAHD